MCCVSCSPCKVPSQLTLVLYLTFLHNSAISTTGNAVSNASQFVYLVLPLSVPWKCSACSWNAGAGVRMQLVTLSLAIMAAQRRIYIRDEITKLLLVTSLLA